MNQTSTDFTVPCPLIIKVSYFEYKFNIYLVILGDTPEGQLRTVWYTLMPGKNPRESCAG